MKIETKLKKNFGTEREYNESCFVHTDGTITPCKAGQEHWVMCNPTDPEDLATYLREGGIRIKIHYDELAVESLVERPTKEQLLALKQIISKNKFNRLVVSFVKCVCDTESFRRVTFNDLIKCLGD